ncbi:aminoacyltransferase [Streptococcus pyogenes]|uniref:aminoacyltransferase n=1 Tax=Streptococcus pyogenes TaxID=1314 RepID=UPI0010A15D62|nr:lipid II:glycine glycyltransferase FemX [Streptococcus pyogenes]VGU28862.1 femAB family protein [Streptococcus pyogenes]HEP1290788.1 aminoacyltransferase [Streptococcus pyogenes]
MALIEISQEQFDHYCHSLVRHSFIQTSEMASLMAKRGAKPQFLGLEKDGELKVAAMVFSQKVAGGWRMELNAGPNTNHPEELEHFYTQLKDYAKQKDVIELILKPYDNYQSFDTDGIPISHPNTDLISLLTALGYKHDGLKTGYPEGEPVWHYVKKLEGIDSSRLTHSFSKKGKALIKKANTFGIKLRQLKRDELHHFKEITEATSDRRDYLDKSLSYYQDFYDSFGDSCEFIVATLNFEDYLNNLKQRQLQLATSINKVKGDLGKNPHSEKKQNRLKELSSQFETFQVRISEALHFLEEYGTKDVFLAGSLFIYTEQEAVYLFSGSYPKFNKFYSPALLQEHAMLKAIHKGIKQYNFLGITGNFDGSDGVLRFKQNFNGFILQKPGTFRCYPFPIKYHFIRLAKKLLNRY